MFSNYKSTNSSRRMQGKRSLANLTACKLDLQNEIKLLFKSFKEVLEMTNDALLHFPPQYRSKVLEASVLQSKQAEKLSEVFGNKVKFGKYRRLILSLEGYIILFKKLSRNGFPMNIKTGNIQSILNQQQTLDLFNDTDYNDDPILYFGYQKDRFGQFINPQIVYIDESEIVFTISESDFDIYPGDEDLSTKPVSPVSPSPYLKGIKKKVI